MLFQNFSLIGANNTIITGAIVCDLNDLFSNQTKNQINHKILL